MSTEAAMSEVLRRVAAFQYLMDKSANAARDVIGHDATGAVAFGVSSAGTPLDIVLSPHWRRQVPPGELENAVMTAYQDAMTQHFTQMTGVWLDEPKDLDAVVVPADFQEQFDEQQRDRVQAAETQLRSALEGGALDVESALTEIERLRVQREGIETGLPTLPADEEEEGDHVSFTVNGHTVSACHVSAQWQRTVPAEGAEQQLNDALQRALTEQEKR